MRISMVTAEYCAVCPSIFAAVRKLIYMGLLYGAALGLLAVALVWMKQLGGHITFKSAFLTGL